MGSAGVYKWEFDKGEQSLTVAVDGPLNVDDFDTTVQAAIDGIGVAMGRTSYVQDDIAKGRLVVPFKIALPADAGFYLVSPEGRREAPKLVAFREWMLAATQNKA